MAHARAQAGTGRPVVACQVSSPGNSSTDRTRPSAGPSNFPCFPSRRPPPRAPPTSSPRTARRIDRPERSPSDRRNARRRARWTLAMASRSCSSPSRRRRRSSPPRDRVRARPSVPPSSSSARAPRATRRNTPLTHPALRFRSPSAEKTARMRQAKEEADAEIAAYRAQREATYQKMLAEVRVRTHPLSAPQIRRVP